MLTGSSSPSPRWLGFRWRGAGRVGRSVVPQPLGLGEAAAPTQDAVAVLHALLPGGGEDRQAVTSPGEGPDHAGHDVAGATGVHGGDHGRFGIRMTGEEGQPPGQRVLGDGLVSGRAGEATQPVGQGGIVDALRQVVGQTDGIAQSVGVGHAGGDELGQDDRGGHGAGVGVGQHGAEGGAGRAPLGLAGPAGAVGYGPEKGAVAEGVGGGGVPGDPTAEPAGRRGDGRAGPAQAPDAAGEALGQRRGGGPTVLVQFPGPAHEQPALSPEGTQWCGAAGRADVTGHGSEAAGHLGGGPVTSGSAESVADGRAEEGGDDAVTGAGGDRAVDPGEVGEKAALVEVHHRGGTEEGVEFVEVVRCGQRVLQVLVSATYSRVDSNACRQ